MIVFLLRHADRSDANDDINEDGVRRAKLLARMLSESGVSVAFRSDTNRAAKTVEPLKAKLGGALQINAIEKNDSEPGDVHAKRVADAVRALPANATVVVVVGHSETLGPTIKRLDGGMIEKIQPAEFDKLFVLFIPPSGAPTLLKLRYGEKT
jgi:phosphohistidine phosphatase SixA